LRGRDFVGVDRYIDQIVYISDQHAEFAALEFTHQDECRFTTPFSKIVNGVQLRYENRGRKSMGQVERRQVSLRMKRYWALRHAENNGNSRQAAG
jgi:hypothetical protein